MILDFYKKMLFNFENSQGDFLILGDNKHSYVECISIIKKIYNFLSKFKQKKILVYTNKTVTGYSAIFSIIFSDNIWIPLAPTLPKDRLKLIVDILKPELILYDDILPEELAHFPHKNLSEILQEVKEVSINSLPENTNNVAYIMFTSGSTGVPKGVPMTHLNYINFINNALDILPFSDGEIFSDYHDFSFDISIFYLFCAPMTKSAISALVKPEEKLFPFKNAQDKKVTVWSSVPSYVTGLMKYRPTEKQISDIKIMFLCGEPLPLPVYEYCYEKMCVPHIYNFYGLTETGVENFYHKCEKSDLDTFKDKGFMPIGLPLRGNNVRINPEKELLISGVQVTPGYIGGIEKSRFEIIDSEIWYHTGDIVEVFSDKYFCKGRIDSQIKLGGFRIEVMDIEVNLKKCSNVVDAICFLDDSGPDKKLVACLKSNQLNEFNQKVIIAELKKLIPEYMIPKKYFCLSEMPLNSNGKIDRKFLKQKYSGS